MAGISPLKARPLRNPGDSVDAEIRRWVDERLLDPFFFVIGFVLLAYMEWVGYLTHAPRRPILFTCVALIATVIAAARVTYIYRRVQNLKLGRDGEKVVGQFLERLRESGAQVFHDIPGDAFNLDHVIIAPSGVYAVETKTLTKPWPKASVLVEDDVLLVAGKPMGRCPIEQVTAASRWLVQLLESTTGKRFKVRGVVVFPGWFVKQRSPRGDVWVLEPKMLPGFIEQEPVLLSPADVKLAAFHLSRYVRSEMEKALG